MPTGPRRTAAAGITLIALALTACGGSAGSTSNDSPAVAAQVDRDAQLRVGYVIAPGSLDPHRTPSDLAAYSYIAPVYDRLTQMVTGESGAELAPMVAMSWEFSEDGRAVTFTLREGITFSDGQVLDAAAVKASLDRGLTVQGSTVTGLLSTIASVEAPDATHVVVHTTRPAADLPYVLSGTAGALISPAALNNPDLDVRERLKTRGDRRVTGEELVNSW